MRQVGRAADQFRQQRRERLERHLRGLARGDHRAFGLQLGDVRRRRAAPSRPATRPRAAREFGGQFRDARGVARRTRRSTASRAARPALPASQPS